MSLTNVPTSCVFNVAPSFDHCCVSLTIIPKKFSFEILSQIHILIVNLEKTNPYKKA